jgi:hypothetical protein
LFVSAIMRQHLHYVATFNARQRPHSSAAANFDSSQ